MCYGELNLGTFFEVVENAHIFFARIFIERQVCMQIVKNSFRQK